MARFRPLHSMIGGILINTLGLTFAVLTRNPHFLVLSILIFSIGEMAFSPKILEYIGRIAPREKAALYMGTQFLPIALGNFIGGFIAGGVYEKLADKISLTRRLLGGEADPSLTPRQVTQMAMEKFNLTNNELTATLWDKYEPYHFAFVLAGMGMFTVVLLFFYDLWMSKQIRNQKG